MGQQVRNLCSYPCFIGDKTEGQGDYRTCFWSQETKGCLRLMNAMAKYLCNPKAESFHPAMSSLHPSL